MVVSFAQKHMIICLSIALCIIFFVCPIYSQNSGKKYIDSSEYIHFVNDTFIEFILIRSIKGAIATRYYGVGKYEIENDQLLIFNYFLFLPEILKSFIKNKNIMATIKKIFDCTFYLIENTITEDEVDKESVSTVL